MIKKLFCIGFFLITVLNAKSQGSLMNLKYVHSNGVTDTVTGGPIVIDINNNVTVSGNHKVSATQYDASTAQALSNGIMTWTNSFNLSTQKAWVAASKTDASGCIFVTGGVATGTTNGVDLFVRKYNASGSIAWTYTYNGVNSSSDVGTSIYLHGTNVFVCGVSDGTITGLADYVTIRLDAGTGSQSWLSTYDYSNSVDVATQVIAVSGTYIFVSGYSGSTLTNWDYCTVRYSYGTGAQQTVSRTANPGTGQDMTFGAVTDTLGNLYVTGRAFNNVSGNYDVQTQKLDSNLNVIWSRFFNGNNLNDAGINIALDDSLNVLVTGYSLYQDSTLSNLIVLKYDTGGVLKWSSKKRPPANGSSAEGVRIKVKNGNEIFVGGNFRTGTNQDLVLLRYNKFGKQTLEKTYNGPLNSTDKFLDFALRQDSNFVFVSGRTDAGGGLDSNIVIKYEYQNYTVTPVTNTTSGITSSENEVIIKFYKPCLKMNAINDKRLMFGKLSDFVQDSTCAKITSVLPAGTFTCDAATFPTRKIYVDMSEADSISISRMGDTVRIPPFYTSLLVSIPSFIDYQLAADTIKTIDPDVCYSSLNLIGNYDWVPNDTLYAPDQASLHPTVTYTNAHINCEPAWDHTFGESFVRAGIFDSGVYVAHQDLAGSTDPGYDYVWGNPGDPFTNDNFGHGTKVAGTLGARSNNNQGVAGVAGGNIALPQNGVTVVNTKIGEDIITLNWVLNGYWSAATNNPNPGPNNNNQNLNIMNSSFGFTNINYNYPLVEVIDYVNQNGVAFVASRGNFVSPVPSPAHLQFVYSSNLPATLKPKIIMNVGASGTDGQWHKAGINGTNFYSPEVVDFVAPGDNAIVKTTKAFPTEPVAPNPIPASEYIVFGGTSASAPHVSGVAGLMMSYRNINTPNWDNLVHEDCEYLMKKTATDLTITPVYNQSVGIDPNTGKGRINAGDALVALEPQYNIRHIDAAHYSTSTSQTSSMVASNVVCGWPGVSNYYPFADTYSVNIYKVTTIYSYSFPGETYLDSWPLYKASKGTPSVNIGAQIFEDEPHDVEVPNATISSATLISYAYKLIQATTPGAPIANKYFPPHPTNSGTFQVKSAFTLYTITGPVKIDEKKGDLKHFNVYPNPNSGKFTIEFVSITGTKAHLQIMDVMGKIVYDENLSVNMGHNNRVLTLHNLTKGIYFVNLDIDNNKSMVKKLIIN